MFLQFKPDYFLYIHSIFCFLFIQSIHSSILLAFKTLKNHYVDPSSSAQIQEYLKKNKDFNRFSFSLQFSSSEYAVSATLRYES